MIGNEISLTVRPRWQRVLRSPVTFVRIFLVLKGAIGLVAAMKMASYFTWTGVVFGYTITTEDGE